LISTELELVVPPSTDFEVDELAEQAEDEHRAVCEAIESAFTHALKAGEALLAIQRMIPRGAWRAWLRERGTIPENTAMVYMRIAHYRDRTSSQLQGRISICVDYRRSVTAAKIQTSISNRKCVG
jgi:hypothetical protein